jgi:hypothetical protein
MRERAVILEDVPEALGAVGAQPVLGQVELADEAVVLEHAGEVGGARGAQPVVGEVEARDVAAGGERGRDGPQAGRAQPVVAQRERRVLQVAHEVGGGHELLAAARLQVDRLAREVLALVLCDKAKGKWLEATTLTRLVVGNVRFHVNSIYRINFSWLFQHRIIDDRSKDCGAFYAPSCHI